jgi:hypothetical protein
MHSKLPLKERLHTLLVLGRVSNLPTVWSNCLAAWLLGGSGLWERFAIVGTGATLLYTGGMFLNDAFDAQFDRDHRPERPIPSGKIGRRAVWILSAAFLFIGWLMVVTLGTGPALFASLLVVDIVVYNWLHKRSNLGILLMAGCRFLLYLVAAAAAQGAVQPEIWWRACALALYIVGISALARSESTGPAQSRWWGGILFVPVGIALARSCPAIPVRLWVVSSVLGLWILFCVSKAVAPGKRGLGGGVAGLLAGVVLVDWLAVASQEQTPGLVFIGLFCLALVMQRIAPAT